MSNSICFCPPVKGTPAIFLTASHYRTYGHPDSARDEDPLKILGRTLSHADAMRGASSHPAAMADADFNSQRGSVRQTSLSGMRVSVDITMGKREKQLDLELLQLSEVTFKSKALESSEKWFSAY